MQGAFDIAALARYNATVMETFTAPGLELRRQDCLAFLATLADGCADLAIIDPPYEVSRETNFRSGAATGRDTDRFRVSMDFGEWDWGCPGLGEAIQGLYRALRDGGTLVCFYDVWKVTGLRGYFEAAGFKQLRLIEWLKTNPVPINSKVNYLTNAREIAVVGVKKGKPTFNSEYDDGVYKYPICHDAGRFHPTQKPLELIEELVRKHSNGGDLVLDCFSGSGTTAVASLRNGRRFAGCELDRSYWAQAVERVKREIERP